MPGKPYFLNMTWTNYCSPEQEKRLIYVANNCQLWNEDYTTIQQKGIGDGNSWDRTSFYYIPSILIYLPSTQGVMPVAG